MSERTHVRCYSPERPHVFAAQFLLSLRGAPTLHASFTRLRDDGDKIAEVSIFQHTGELARRPRLVVLRVDTLDSLKGVAAGWRWKLAAHGFLFTRSHGSDEERIIHTQILASDNWNHPYTREAAAKPRFDIIGLHGKN